MGKIVNPQAPRSLWPTDTPGSAGSPAPITFQPGATRWTQYRSEGNWMARCGSLASSGVRVDVRSPESTQLLLPSVELSPVVGFAIGTAPSWPGNRPFPRYSGFDVRELKVDRSARRGIGLDNGIADPSQVESRVGIEPRMARVQVEKLAGPIGPQARARAGRAAARWSHSGTGRCGGTRRLRASTGPA